MDITVAEERIFLITEQLKMNDAEEKARVKKIDAFGAVTKVASFLNRPKEEDFELTYREFRYQPFWHITCHARYVYDRKSMYRTPTHGAEVKSVTLLDHDFPIINEQLEFPLVEHCVQDEEEVVFMDGLTSQKAPDFKKYSQYASIEYKKDDSEGALPKDAILVPPQARVSAVVRETVGKMIHGISADTIFEEHVDVRHADLYYRPVYAFQFKWLSKAKEAIIEVDGLTGEVTTGNKMFKEYMGKMLDVQFLFDVGADAVGMIIPGGNIAVKVVKRVIDTRTQKKK